MFSLLILIGLIFLIIGNCFMGLSKNRMMYITYLVLSSILTLIGVIGIAFTFNRFHARLIRRLNNEMVDNVFVTWATDKFMQYVLISLIITGITMFLLLFIIYLKRNNTNTILFAIVTPISVSIRCILVIYALIYSYETINKFFDIAGYITSLSIFECFTLYLPSIIQKIILHKNNYGSKE